MNSKFTVVRVLYIVMYKVHCNVLVSLSYLRDSLREMVHKTVFGPINLCHTECLDSSVIRASLPVCCIICNIIYTYECEYSILQYF